MWYSCSWVYNLSLFCGDSKASVAFLRGSVDDPAIARILIYSDNIGVRWGFFFKSEIKKWAEEEGAHYRYSVIE